MDDRQLDDLLTSEVGNRYLKVARIMGGALRRLEQADPSKRVGWPGCDGFDEVWDALLERVNALVDAGSLKAQGNTWWPRFSEVRLPNDDDRERMAARMDEREVDVILLSIARHRWQKVLKVVSLTLDRLAPESEPEPPWWPAEDESVGWVWDAITERIEVLVETGRLEARGNIWRRGRSEIRLRDAANLRNATPEFLSHAEIVARHGSLDADRVDAVLLSLLDHRFKKVARMVADTITQLRPPEAGISSEDFETVLTRIEALIELGTIESDGDVRQVGYTQIRLRDAA